MIQANTPLLMFKTVTGSIFQHDGQASAQIRPSKNTALIHILIWFGLSEGLGQANVSSSG